MEDAQTEITVQEAEAAAQPEAMPQAEPEVQPQYVPDEETRNKAIVKSARKVFSRMGGACCVMFAIAGVLSVLLLLRNALFIDDQNKQLTVLATSVFSTQIVGMSIACLMLRRMPRFIAEPESFGFGKFLKCVPICIFLALGGNFAATLLDNLLGDFLGYSPASSAESMDFIDVPFWGLVLLLAVIGPFFEELLFRKVLIDRMRGYGERLAVVTSALMFGLMHGNLVQSFYAFLVGLLFGYVYLKSGRLGYSYGLHLIMNMVTGVIMIEFAKDPSLRDLIMGSSSGIGLIRMEGEVSQTAIFFSVYSILLTVLSVAGLVLLIVSAKRVRFGSAPLQIPKGCAFSSVWLNLGMIFFVLLSIGSAVIYIIQTQ